MKPFVPISRYFYVEGEKSVWQLNQLENVVGPDLMKVAIADIYLPQQGNLSLLDSIQLALELNNLTHVLPRTNVTVGDLVNDWSAKPFFNKPVLTVNMLNNGSLLIRQTDGVKWLPIILLNSRGNQSLLWIPDNEAVIYSDKDIIADIVHHDKWVAVIQNGYASFRVIYDAKLTALLAQQLLLNHTALPTSLRIQLINDYFSCTINSCGGLPPVPIEVAMDLTKYLDKETEELVWKAFNIWSSNGRSIYFWNTVYQKFRTLKEGKDLPRLKVSIYQSSKFHIQWICQNKLICV